MSTVVVVDDHPMVAQGLCAALAARGIAAEAIDPTVEDPSRYLMRYPAELCVMDLYWKQGPFPGVGAIPDVVDTGAACVVLTGTAHEPLLGYCLELGAVGVVAKQQGFADVVERVIDAVEGRSPNSDADRLRWMLAAQQARRAYRRTFAPFELLTSSERDVLADLVRGRSVSDIAAARCVAVSTVRTHVRQVLTKLDVRSQVGAVAMVAEVGWNLRPSEAVFAGAPDLPAMLPR